MQKSISNRGLRALLMSAAVPLALSAGVHRANAVTVTIVGTNGADGTLGIDGGAGGPGADVSAFAGYTVPNSDSVNGATAVGGNGGKGADDLMNGNVGPGGPGGTATARAVTAAAGGPLAATTFARGGAGGAPGEFGGSTGFGGAGGGSFSYSTVTASGADDASATANATGGAGANGRVFANEAQGEAPIRKRAAPRTADRSSLQPKTTAARAVGATREATGATPRPRSEEQTGSGHLMVTSKMTGGAGGHRRHRRAQGRIRDDPDRQRRFGQRRH